MSEGQEDSINKSSTPTSSDTSDAKELEADSQVDVEVDELVALGEAAESKIRVEEDSVDE